MVADFAQPGFFEVGRSASCVERPSLPGGIVFAHGVLETPADFQPNRMMILLIVLTTLLTGGHGGVTGVRLREMDTVSRSGGSQSKPAANGIEKWMEWFDHQSPTLRAKIVEHTKKIVAANETPWLASVRALATRAAAVKPRAVVTQSKNSPEGSFPLSGELPFPLFREYVFGARTIRNVEVTKKSAAPTASNAMRAMLHGHPPDADLALAELLQMLDHDRSADEFAMFLESWRNGDESFYRALDRTAGTPGEVFYYDAMLGQFNQKFFKGDDFTKKKPTAKSLQAAHDALHHGFLTYRQYRAFREAMALSLLIKPADALPKNLSRYEEKPANFFSSRDEACMFAVVNNYDLEKLAAQIVASTPALPESLWEGRHEPVPDFNKSFTSRIAEFNDDPKLGSPATLLKKFETVRLESARRVHDAAITAMTAAGCKVGAPGN